MSLCTVEFPVEVEVKYGGEWFILEVLFTLEDGEPIEVIGTDVVALHTEDGKPCSDLLPEVTAEGLLSNLYKEAVEEAEQYLWGNYVNDVYAAFERCRSDEVAWEYVRAKRYYD